MKKAFVSAFAISLLILSSCGTRHVHEYGDPSWDWEAVAGTTDYTATATFTCSKGDDVQTVTATVSKSEEPGANCGDMGHYVYTAAAEFNGSSYTDEHIAESSVKEHNWSTEWSTDETYHWHDCTNGCGSVSDKEEHAFDDGTVLTPATHYETGTTRYTCTVCGYQKDVTTEIIPHEYSDSWSYDTTAHWHECECGAKKDEADHEMGDWTVTKTPSYTETGKKERTCTVCGYLEEEAVDALVPVTSISFAQDGITHKMNDGKTLDLEIAYEPQTASLDSIEFSSDDESVATVNGKTVTFTGLGTVTISATAKNDSAITDSVTLTVTCDHEGKHYAAVALNPATIATNEFYQCDVCGNYFVSAMNDTDLEVSGFAYAGLASQILFCMKDGTGADYIGYPGSYLSTQFGNNIVTEGTKSAGWWYGNADEGWLKVVFNTDAVAGDTFTIKSGSVFSTADGAVPYTMKDDTTFTWDGSSWTYSVTKSAPAGNWNDAEISDDLLAEIDAAKDTRYAGAKQDGTEFSITGLGYAASNVIQLKVSLPEIDAAYQGSTDNVLVSGSNFAANSLLKIYKNGKAFSVSSFQYYLGNCFSINFPADSFEVGDVFEFRKGSYISDGTVTPYVLSSTFECTYLGGGSWTVNADTTDVLFDGVKCDSHRLSLIVNCPEFSASNVAYSGVKAERYNSVQEEYVDITANLKPNFWVESGGSQVVIQILDESDTSSSLEYAEGDRVTISKGGYLKSSEMTYLFANSITLIFNNGNWMVA